MLRALRGWIVGKRGTATPAPPAAMPEPMQGADAAAVFERAVEEMQRGETPKAEETLRGLIEAWHDFAPAHALLGHVLRKQGRLDDAVDSFVLAQCFDPALPDAYYGLGSVSLQGERYAEAVEPLRQAAELAPADAKTHNALGVALLNLERVEEARSCFMKAVELQPAFAEAHSNLGYVLFRDFAQFEEGAAHIERALEIAPLNRSALCNWTMVLQYRGRLKEAVQLCDELLAEDPSLLGAKLNRGLMLLSMGRFETGWQDYEARKQTRCNYAARGLPLPDWDGTPLNGRGIYVYGEQGIGDEIMFSSCLPDVLREARSCVVECSPKLQPIFQRTFPNAIVVARGTKDIGAISRDAGVECQISMGSLPFFLRRFRSSFPRHAGYLQADPLRVEHWRAQLHDLPGGLKVGISWRGGMKTTRQNLRSIPLDEWAPVFGVAGVDFVDLQYFACTDEIQDAGRKHGVMVHRWPEALDDYDETAALVGALDLIISVQTAIVHLSGAMGRPVWALIPVAPEWRYLSEGTSMPWYPSVQLMRQQCADDWHLLMEVVSEELRRQVGQARKVRRP